MVLRSWNPQIDIKICGKRTAQAFPSIVTTLAAPEKVLTCNPSELKNWCVSHLHLDFTVTTRVSGRFELHRSWSGKIIRPQLLLSLAPVFLHFWNIYEVASETITKLKLNNTNTTWNNKSLATSLSLHPEGLPNVGATQLLLVHGFLPGTPYNYNRLGDPLNSRRANT